MIELDYKLITLSHISKSSLFLLSKIKNRASDKIRINLPETRQGYIIINSKKYKIDNGKAEIFYNELPEGLVEPRIVVGTKSLFATPFFKEGDSVSKVPIEDGKYQIIENAFSELFARMDVAEDKISALEEKTQPINLFEFYKKGNTK